MDNAVRRMGRQDVVAALHIWSKYGVPTMGRAGDSTLDQSITTEPVWQYDPVKACKLMRDQQCQCRRARHAGRHADGQQRAMLDAVGGGRAVRTARHIGRHVDQVPEDLAGLRILITAHAVGHQPI